MVCPPLWKGRPSQAAKKPKRPSRSSAPPPLSVLVFYRFSSADCSVVGARPALVVDLSLAHPLVDFFRCRDPDQLRPCSLRLLRLTLTAYLNHHPHHPHLRHNGYFLDVSLHDSHLPKV